MSDVQAFYENRGLEPRLTPLEFLGSTTTHNVSIEAVAALAEVAAASGERERELFELADLTDAVHQEMAGVDAFYYKRAERAEGLGLPQAVIDQINADGDQHNTENADRLDGLADMLLKYKNRLTTAQKSELDTYWTNNRTAIIAVVDQEFQETLLDAGLWKEEVQSLLTIKTNAYADVDLGIANALQEASDQTTALATLRRGPDRGRIPDAAHDHWTKAKAGSVVVEVLIIILLIYVCSRWTFCLFKKEIKKKIHVLIDKIDKSKKKPPSP